MSWLWLTPLLALVVTWILGRYNARAIERDWEMMLTAKGRGAIEALELQVLCDGAAVESARIGALSARERADFPQATRLAGLAYRAVEEATPDRLKRLRAMGVCIRMATAILPVPALKPRNFRLAQLSSLAGLSKFIHHLLVSTGERFLLRLYVLGLGLPHHHAVAERIVGEREARRRRRVGLGHLRPRHRGLVDPRARARRELPRVRPVPDRGEAHPRIGHLISLPGRAMPPVLP